MEISLKKEFDQFILEQAGARQFRNPDDYVNELISREMRREKLGWSWLRDQLEPAPKANPSEYVSVTAEEVIERNKKRHGLE